MLFRILRGRICQLLCGFFFSLPPLFASSESGEPLRIAVFGDSITRGVIADSPLGPKARVLDGMELAARSIVVQLSLPVILENEGVLTTAFMDAVDFSARDHLAFAQGTAPYSLRSRLEASGKAVEFQIIARLGGSYRIGDLQLARFKELLRTQPAPDLILVDMGRIDLAIFSSVEDFNQQVDAFFKKLTTISPQSRILLVEVGNLPSALFRADTTSVTLPAGVELSCGAIIQSIGIASKLGIRPGFGTDASFSTAQARRNGYNAKLHAVAAAYAARGTTISIVNAFNERQNPDDWNDIFAADCIHFNQNGHAEIAANLWAPLQEILAQPPSQTAPPEVPATAGMSAASLQLWQNYLDTVPMDALQAECRPRILPAVGEARGVVMLYHGFTACPQQFSELAPELAARGFIVVLPLIPGHGRLWQESDQGPRDNIQNLPSGMLSAAHSYRHEYFGFVSQMNQLAASFGGERVVGGLSLGASLATLATVTQPALWDRQVIMSPYYETGLEPLRALLGTLSNTAALGGTSLVQPLLDTEFGWGERCERERPGRAGVCQFTFDHMLGANQAGYEASSLMRPTTIQSQFVLVEGDPVINHHRVYNGVAKLRSERLGKAKFTSAERRDQHPDVRICYIPSSFSLCVSNDALATVDQPTGCVNHSLLARVDSPTQNKYWIDILVPKLVSFIVDGQYLSQDATRRVDGDPSCADFPVPSDRQSR